MSKPAIIAEEWLREAMGDWPCSCEVPTEPYRIEQTELGWFVGWYRCSSCGRTWRCGWDLSALRRQMGE